jgi:hypothetical protein
MANLLNIGRHTVTGAIVAAGRQFLDWNATYRLFSRNRINTSNLFDVNIKEIEATLKPRESFRILIDDTLCKKSGRNMPGVTLHRDPLGPKYRPNFVMSQRFIQFSAVLDEAGGSVRGIPVGFYHTPSPQKPPRKATPETLDQYKVMQQQMRLPKKAAEHICAIRNKVNPVRNLLVVGDGGYTNKTVLRNLPKKTSFIGRIRKDAKLFSMPDINASIGRKRLYGQAVPTPEEMRKDDTIEWKHVSGFVSGKMRDFQIKIIRGLRSKISAGINLKVVIVRPVGYRLTQKSKLLYREPAYLISTDDRLEGKEILRNFLARWQIEINFRDEKNILGIDEPQVRNINSVENLPAFMVATYGMLMLAGHHVFKRHGEMPPLPKWRNSKKVVRHSISQYIASARNELMNKTQFASACPDDTKPFLFESSLKSMLNFATR